ncbi:MAG: EamA family transporter, partial [Aeromonas sobria]
MGYEWLALGSASLWAVAALISVKPARHLGAFAYSRWRMFLVSLMLGSVSLLTGGWQTLTASAVPLLAISGLIGIFVGDTALFACMNRLGPRRSALLFSCHALFSALLGLWLFNETLTDWRLLGAMLVFAGVMLAILFGRR